MTSIIARRLLGRNLIKLKDFPSITNHSRCMSVFVINCNRKNGLSLHHFEQKLPLFVGSNRIQFYSDKKVDKKEEKPSLFQRFKQMYKDYWYVLIPVHLITSAAWFGGFYYLAKSGVDIPALLDSLHISEKITNPLRNSSMGYIAVSYALYKIATPARYTVTLGGTTISINYLTKWGYIKPAPSPERLKEMYLEKKDNLLETMRETKEGFKAQSEKLKDKKENIIEDIDKSIKQIKKMGDKIKGKEHVVEEVKKKNSKKTANKD